MKNKNLPFILCAIAGAAGLTAMAYLASVKDETDINNNNKKIKYLIKELNLLFFYCQWCLYKNSVSTDKNSSQRVRRAKRKFFSNV